MENMPKAGEFCWTELATANVSEAKQFYSKVFGWQFKDHHVGDMTYTMIGLNGKDFGGIWAIPKDQQKEIPPHWMSYILVNNLEESLTKAKSAGATIVKPSTKAGEMGIFAIITDPTGAHIALWQTLSSK